MAIFIELTTDPFDAQFSAKANNGGGKLRVRRPTRGLELKDETHAYLKMIRVDGSPVALFDSSSAVGRSHEYANFILQSVQEQRMERHQIVETFGDTYLFMFGESPRFLNITAAVVNSFDFNWKDEFMANYDKYLRGTKAIEMGARTYLFWDTNIVEGYILNCQLVSSAETPQLVPLTFQFYVTNSQSISMIGSMSAAYPIRASAIFPQGIDPTKKLTGYNQLRTLQRYQEGPIEKGRPILPINPLRTRIADNEDEFTTGLQPTMNDLNLAEAGRIRRDMANIKKEPTWLDKVNNFVKDLNRSIGNFLQKFNVNEKWAYGPQSAKALGYNPYFGPGGVPMGPGGFAGAGATFGAYASAGAFAGISVGASAGAFAGAGVFAGAGAGAYAGSGAGLGAGAYNQGVNKNPIGYQPFGLAGGGVGAYAYIGPDGAHSGTFNTMTDRNQPGFGYGFQPGAGVGVGAFASSNAFANSNYYQQSYAYSSTRAAARAGGYAGANAGLGFQGYNGFSGASYAGGYGAGGSTFIGGAVTAFAFTSAPGQLRNPYMPPPGYQHNPYIPPYQALNNQPGVWNYSDSYHYP